jgi:transposase
MATAEVSMSSKWYTDELKVADVAERLGVTTHSLYAWLRKFGKPGVVQRRNSIRVPKFGV